MNVCRAVFYKTNLSQRGLFDTGPKSGTTQMNNESVRNGYQPLELEELADLFPAGSFRFFADTTSTNDRALEWIRESPPSGPALVLAATQTAGRGQQNRSWFSAPGNLMGSWIVTARLEPSLRGQWLRALALAVPLAVCDTILALDVAGRCQPGIKWPNDVLVEHRKVGGILIESLQQEEQTSAVVGIGLNIHGPLPTDAAGSASPAIPAGSLGAMLGTETPLAAWVKQLTRNLDARCAGLAAEQINREGIVPDALHRDYQQRMLFRDQAIEFETPAGMVAGICRGISSQGGLVIETGTGREQFMSGRIRTRPGPS